MKVCSILYVGVRSWGA